MFCCVATVITETRNSLEMNNSNRTIVELKVKPMLPVVDDKLLTRYLLGGLSESQQAQVEEQLFADTACYDRLCALKAELTDQYVRGDLTSREQQVFARRFLTTKDGREDELFARALDVVLREERAERQPVITQTAATLSWREKLAQYFQPFPAWQMALTAATLLLVAGAAFLFVETQRLRQQLDIAARQLAGAQTEAQQAARTEAELAEQLRRARARNEELDQLSRTAQQERDQARQELARRSSSGSMLGTMLSLILVPGAGRGGAHVDELSLTPQTQRVQLQLLLSPGENQPNYRAEIRTKQGDLIHTQNQLLSRRTKDGKALQLTIPAQLLKDGSYVVSLFGVPPGQAPELINHYDFKISRGK